MQAYTDALPLAAARSDTCPVESAKLRMPQAGAVFFTATSDDSTPQ